MQSAQCDNRPATPMTRPAITYEWKLREGYFYAITPQGVLEAAALAAEQDLDISFNRFLERRTQPKECQRLEHSVAVMSAIHDLYPTRDPRSLRIYEVPDAFTACRRVVDVEYVRRFLLAWRAGEPRDKACLVWAMFANANDRGEIVHVPVRRPSS